jgi:hypothetical protein
MAVSRKLIRELRKVLSNLADPTKAPIMQAYMKSAMPYLGIQAVPFRKATKAVLAAHPLDSFEDWRDSALALWRGARFREERYAVISAIPNIGSVTVVRRDHHHRRLVGLRGFHRQPAHW